MNIAIWGLWIWLFQPVYSYLGTIFTRQEFRTNQIVLLAAMALLSTHIRRGQYQLKLHILPQLYPPALVLALGSAALFVLVEQYVDINTLSASLFGLATYGLLGLWMRPSYWRQGLPAALLLVGALPFGEHMETFIGYPIRVATARLVGEGLATFGVPNLGSETILVFENGLSQVDNPCSGVKSLWTGALFLLAATWIERRRVDRRWLLVAFLFVVLLLAANLARVAILVTIGQVLGLHLLAEMLHLPLGVIGFLTACVGGLALLRWVSTPVDTQPQRAGENDLVPQRPAWLAPCLGLAISAFIVESSLVPTPVQVDAFHWEFPRELNAQVWPLSASELAWLSNDGTVAAERYRFNWEHLDGSLLMVASQDWRAQHKPERCFTVYGLEVQSSQPILAEPDFPLRLLALGTPGGKTLYSAFYWLQSKTQITDDYAARIWDDLTPKPQPWVLVTVIFDEPVDAQSQGVRNLLAVVRDTARNALTSASHP